MALIPVPVVGIFDDVSGRLIGFSVNGGPGVNFPEGTPKARLMAYNPVARATLAALPTASGQGATSRAIATNLGPTDMDLVSDGTNWRPANGEACIKISNGTVASPVASLATTGAASLITLPSDISLPPKLIIPNSRIRVEAEFHRSGANGTITVGAYLGNNKTTADPLLGTVDFTTTQTSLWVEFSARFGSSVNTYYAATGTHQKGQGSASAFADRTIVGANQAYVSFGSTANVAGDTLTLLGYRVTLEV